MCYCGSHSGKGMDLSTCQYSYQPRIYRRGDQLFVGLVALNLQLVCLQGTLCDYNIIHHCRCDSTPACLQEREAYITAVLPLNFRSTPQCNCIRTAPRKAAIEASIIAVTLPRREPNLNLLVPPSVMCGTQHVRYLHCKHIRHVPDFCQQPPKTYYPLLKTVAILPCHDWEGKAPPVPVVWLWENSCRECILEKKIMRILACVPDYFDQPGNGAALCKEYGLAS